MNIPPLPKGMLEYIILLVLLLSTAGAAKKGRRRYIKKIKVRSTVAMATLLQDTGLLDQLTGDTASEQFFAVSVDLSVAWEDDTAGDGPIDIYVAHSDYSLTECEEYIELDTGFGRADLRAQEIQRRKIRFVGTIDNEQPTLNDGNPVRVPLKFMLETGQTVQAVYYNRGDDLTTGSNMKATGQIWGRWA